jgi:membrane protein DedA with SNARE-associated domain
MPPLPEVTSFLAAHGSMLILPVAIIEGPVVAVIAGALSAAGILDWPWALLMLVLGDLIGDCIYYAIGRFGGIPLASLSRRWKLDASKAAELADRLRADATHVLVTGKWTHVIGGLVLVGAGMARVRLEKFLLVNLLATLPKSALLLGVGYFAGNIYPLFLHHTILGGTLLACVGVAGLALILRRGGGMKTRDAER